MCGFQMLAPVCVENNQTETRKPNFVHSAIWPLSIRFQIHAQVKEPSE
jgi:hypothetical protein